MVAKGEGGRISKVKKEKKNRSTPGLVLWLLSVFFLSLLESQVQKHTNKNFICLYSIQMSLNFSLPPSFLRRLPLGSSVSLWEADKWLNKDTDRQELPISHSALLPWVLCPPYWAETSLSGSSQSFSCVALIWIFYGSKNRCWYTFLWEHTEQDASVLQFKDSCNLPKYNHKLLKVDALNLW